MLEEMTTALDNLFKVPQEYITFEDDLEEINLFVALTATQIELDYLILKSVKSSVDFLNMIKTHFEGEVQYIGEFEENTRKIDMYLYDILLKEASTNDPSSHNVIELLKRNYIIIKKGKDLDEMWNTLDLMKTLTGEGRRKSLFRMKIFGKKHGRTRNFFNFTGQIKNFLGDEYKDKINTITKLTLYKDTVSFYVGNNEKLNFDELMIATSFDDKEVARLLRKKRKEFKNVAQNHPILNGVNYNFSRNADLYVIRDWFEEMYATHSGAAVYSLYGHRELRVNKLTINGTYSHEEPDTLSLGLSFRAIWAHELLGKLLKVVDERKIKVS